MTVAYRVADTKEQNSPRNFGAKLDEKNYESFDVESGEKDSASSNDNEIVDNNVSRIQEVVFHNICLSIKTPAMNKSCFARFSNSNERPKLQILKNVSGLAKSGEMLALMGPSGSGKTSLMNVLAQRVSPQDVSGQLIVDGKPMTKAFKKQMGFVFQDDLLLWNLTVRETMLFAAKLRLPQKIPLSEKERIVDSLIESLGLKDVANSIIGKEGRRGVSGGERKRASIGVELVTKPSVLFLDEPTSGLDSSTALSLVTLLKDLAKENMIVICSIHQPRENIFYQFDRVLLLTKGCTAFYGPPNDVISYFGNLGLVPPAHTNIADWMLDLTAGKDFSNKSDDNKSLSDKYNELVSTLSVDERHRRFIPTSDLIESSVQKFQDSRSTSSWPTSFIYQLRVLLERQNKQSRGEVFNAVNAFQILAVAAIASAVWFQSTNIRDLTGVFFFVSVQQSFNAMNSILRVFPPERNLMMRERSTGSYRVGPYFLAKTTSDAVLNIIFPFIYATLVYFCAGLRPSFWNFFLFLVLFFSQMFAAQSIGLLLSVVFTDMITASCVTFVLVLVIMLFGGFYVNNDRIPAGVNWIKYVSFLYWGYGALLINEFEGRTFECTAANEQEYGSDTCPIPGEEVISRYGFQDIKIWQSIVILWAMFVFFRFITYAILRKFTKLGGRR